MKKAQTWLAVIIVGIGLIIAVVLGVFAYLSLTATPIHPNAQEVPSVPHSAPPRKWAEAVEQARHIARASVVEQNLPGLSVAVGVGGDIVWAEGLGWADLENKVPVGPQTRFKIGTASPVLTSAAVGLLQEKGRLYLDDVIQMHVPAYPEKKWPVTLRQVMGHLAGVRSDSGDEGPFRSTHCEGTIEGLQLVADASLLFQPGTAYRYSNYGWILVSAAIESAAQEPFFTFMQKQIFAPLGMDDTMPDSVSEPIPDRAMAYFPRGGDPGYGPDGGPRRTDYSCYAGGAAFLSTPSDLVRFGMGLNAGTLLQPATVALLQASQRLPSGEETGYGLGWDRESVTLAGEQTTMLGHDGLWMGGPVSSLMTFPRHGIVVAVTSNIAYADTYGIGVKIAQAFAERAKTPARKSSGHG
jgi:CubicO group peptidase (beta-lactamase class C family)